MYPSFQRLISSHSPDFAIPQRVLPVSAVSPEAQLNRLRFYAGLLEKLVASFYSPFEVVESYRGGLYTAYSEQAGWTLVLLLPAVFRLVFGSVFLLFKVSCH